ncbi:hypothetical protein FUAX_15190 [Fulvitalea axinellae]|uniref:Uncharacterized protein n=1 Tax=Fulvitalea axinellae TaxID=1182444 RepID=A0AAU9CMF6_9BACT|nr:hypothetical protein FUAX_15190 [Fulvitalea axinellae]
MFRFRERKEKGDGLRNKKGKAGGGVVQRYSKVPAGGYVPGKGGVAFSHLALERLEELARCVSERSEFFGEGEGHFTKRKVPEGHLLEEGRRESRPGLKVADDEAFALEDSPERVGRFFTTEDVVRHSNGVFESSASLVRFVMDKGNSLVLGSSGKELFSVVPDLSTIDGCVDCSEMAGRIMGATGDLTQAVVFGSDNYEVPSIAESGMTRKAFEGMEAGKSPRESFPEGERFHTPSKSAEVLRETFKETPESVLTERAKFWGVNESACPEVGEAYLKLAPLWDEEEEIGGALGVFGERLERLYGKYGLGKGAKAPEEMIREQTKILWNMHYGAVVARSGSDSVTLENYTWYLRPVKELIAAFERLWLRFGMFRDLVERYFEHKKEEPVLSSAVYILWEEAAGILKFGESVLDEGSDLRKRVCLVREEFKKNLSFSDFREQPYHFKMYGTDKGYSFHEEWSDTLPAGSVTFRVRESYGLHVEELWQTVIGKWRSLGETVAVLGRSECQEWSASLLQRMKEKEAEMEKEYNDRLRSSGELKAVAELKNEALDRIREMALGALADEFSEVVGIAMPGGKKEALQSLRRVRKDCNDAETEQRLEAFASWFGPVYKALDGGRSFLPF